MAALFIPRFLKTSSKGGAAPGTLEHVGEKKTTPIHINVLQYDEKHCDDFTDISMEQLQEIAQSKDFCWINIDGIHDPKMIEDIGTIFSLHPLLLEDILNTGQRPMLEEYDDCLFTVVKMVHMQDDGELSLEQISMVMKDNFLLSFQEEPKDVFTVLRERLRKGLGKIRSQDAFYLGYRLVDTITDHYFSLLEIVGDHIETLERELIEKPNDATLRSVYVLQQRVLFLRKAAQPLRDVANRMLQNEAGLMPEHNLIFVRDLVDHTIQAVEAIDTYRDLLNNMLNNYLSLMSHRMNSVMKTITMIGSIFIPLTFIVGVYGMNFRHMPELDWVWGYPTVWGVMIALVLGMIVWFKRNEWL